MENATILKSDTIVLYTSKASFLGVIFFLLLVQMQLAF